MQYVGDTKYYKVFVYVARRFFETKWLENPECIIATIPPEEYEYWVTKTPVCGRYQISERDGAFFANEAHRDAYEFHVPGYKVISTLKVGDIIPVNGFNSPVTLSDADVKLMIESNRNRFNV